MIKEKTHRKRKWRGMRKIYRVFFGNIPFLPLPARRICRSGFFPYVSPGVS